MFDAIAHHVFSTTLCRTRVMKHDASRAQGLVSDCGSRPSRIDGWVLTVD